MFQCGWLSSVVDGILEPIRQDDESQRTLAYICLHRTAKVHTRIDDTPVSYEDIVSRGLETAHAHPQDTRSRLTIGASRHRVITPREAIR